MKTGYDWAVARWDHNTETVEDVFYRKQVLEGLEDWVRWKDWFRILCGRVSRVSLAPPLYDRLYRARWAYCESQRTTMPIGELSIYGVRVKVKR